MTPREAMNRVDSGSKSTWTKSELKTLLNEIKPTEADSVTISVSEVRRGDVFYGSLVGGKRRPWLILSVKGRDVVAVAMTTSGAIPGSEPAQCRMWPGSSIGSAVAVFDDEYARANFLRPYSNLAHIRAVEAKLAALLGLRPQDRRSAGPRLSAVEAER